MWLALDRGVFSVSDDWLAVAVIGGMVVRVTYWHTPQQKLGARDIAEVSLK